MADGRKRGRPPGSPNKKPVIDSGLSPVERKIMRKAEDLAGVLIDAAILKGDVKAATYLIDRVLGKAKERVDINQQTETKIVVEYPDDWRKA